MSILMYVNIKTTITHFSLYFKLETLTFLETFFIVKKTLSVRTKIYIKTEKKLVFIKTKLV